MITEADKLFFQAEKMMQDGRVNEAADLLNQVNIRFPDYGKAYSALGSLYHHQLHDFVNAENLYKKGINLSPEYTLTYIWLADILLMHERYPELIATLNKAIEIPGAQKDKVYELFGRMNELQMKLEEAIGYFKKAIHYSFRDEDIAAYESAIRRCIKKKNY